MKREIVIKVAQAPMNPVRWMLLLACGHRVWVTAKHRPTIRTKECWECGEKERER